jgi:predicted transcriptional regulator
MVSHDLMGKFLQAMPEGPISLRKLSQKLERADGNVRRTLLAMRELGIVEEVEISQGKRIIKGWKKTVKIHP